MKCLLFAVWLACAIVNLDPQCKPSKSTETVDGSRATQYNAYVFQGTEGNKASPAADATKAEGQFPHWYASVEWSNWALVFVALGTAGVIGWQSWETRKAATAAADSANAFLTSERAWMLMNPQLIETLQRTDKHRGMLFRWTVKNVGRTPARIVETDARVFRIARADLKKLPTRPHYAGPQLP
jgi:hypothetical protein